MLKDDTLERINKDLREYGWITEEIARMQQRIDTGNVRPFASASAEGMQRHIAPCALWWIGSITPRSALLVGNG